MKDNLSIIIPHYNTPVLLDKLLSTIPEKEDIQIIVVDDNSTKELEEYNAIMQKYADRVEFYKNNAGIQSAGACRNIGLDHAKGIWVMFADADDYFMPRMYESVSKYFETDNEMVIFCPTSIFLDSGEMADRHVIHEERIKRYLLYPTDENLLQVKRMFAPWSKIIKREVIEKEKLRFSTTLHANDMYFVLMADYYCQKTSVSADVIYCITRSTGSLTTIRTEESFDLRVQEYIKCYKFGISHYSKKEFRQLNLNGGVLLFEAYKRHLGMKKVIETYKLFHKNHIPLLSAQTKNPMYLINVVIENNKMINREKKYYVEEKKF